MQLARFKFEIKRREASGSATEQRNEKSSDRSRSPSPLALIFRGAARGGRRSSSKRPTRLLTLHGQTQISPERTLQDDAAALLELPPGCEITLTDVGLFDGMLLLEPGCVTLHSAAPPQPARAAPPSREEGAIDVRPAAEVLEAQVAAAACVAAPLDECCQRRRAGGLRP